MGVRTNPEHKVKEVERPSETVMVFSSDVVDPVLNKPCNTPTTNKIPRPDDPQVMKAIPDWMVAAISSDEALQVTNDPNLIGVRAENASYAYQPGIDHEATDEAPVADRGNASFNTNRNIIPPIQSVMEDFNATRLAKKELIERAALDKSSLSAEREYYNNHRRRRSIPIPSLPSDKKTYPENMSVSYAPYSVKDIEDINNDDLPLYDKYMIMLDGIYTVGMNPLELTFSDFSFIGDTRHLQALGDSYFKYPYVCKTCGRPGTYSFTLSDVGFTTLKSELPLKVRFHTFPTEVFSFAPHTIGDVLHLLKTDRYWRKMGESYMASEGGKKMIDRAAINACRCISHPWEEAYFKILEASENPLDRSILIDIGNALYHDSEPIKFKCVIPVDRVGQREMAETTASLVEATVSGELSTTTPNADGCGDSNIPPWAARHIENETTPAGKHKKMCGADNEIDVLVGDIIIPFRRLPISMEYGIIS